MLGFDVKNLMQLIESGEYESALETCEQFVSHSMTEFMDSLTVETATSFAASAHLYAQICAMIKKPWLAIPKLDSAGGALRFMKDFMTNTEMLCDTYESFATSYAYARFYPEAIGHYEKIAKYTDDKERCMKALKLCYFYEKLFGKEVMEEKNPRAEFISDDELENIISSAEEEASSQILTDPVEHTDEFLLVRFDVEAKVDKAISMSENIDDPYCLRYWNEKQRILKEEFGIEWKTPAQMNPNIRFY